MGINSVTLRHCDVRRENAVNSCGRMRLSIGAGSRCVGTQLAPGLGMGAQLFIRLVCTAVAAMVLGGAAAAVSASQGKGKKQAKHERAADVRERDSHARVTINVAFAPTDVRMMRTHYAPRYRSLPPGLQKKVARGGQLPPGWRKRFEPFPVRLEQQLRPLPHGYRRGVIDGHAVIYEGRTNLIIDVAVLF
jgi:hypothetical protein